MEMKKFKLGESLSRRWCNQYGDEMNALITGGAGFIGSHLAERLVERGDHVTIIDDLSTGSVHNIKRLKGPKFDYFLDTVTNQHLMAELIDAADIVYHLAA